MLTPVLYKFPELSRNILFIMAPHVPDSTFSYEAVPTNISSQEPILSSSNPAPIEVTQPVSSMYNIPQAPPVVNISTAVPQWNVIVPFPQVPHPTTFYQTFLKGKPFALSVSTKVFLCQLLIFSTLKLIL